MRGLNRVMLVGNLGRDPIVKEVAGGMKVAKIALATTEVYKTKDGGAASKTEWHTVIFWRSLAQLVEKYLKTGSLILVEGKLKHRRYLDKAGAMRYVSEVVADGLILLSSKPKVKGAEDDTALWDGVAPF